MRHISLHHRCEYVPCVGGTENVLSAICTACIRRRTSRRTSRTLFPWRAPLVPCIHGCPPRHVASSYWNHMPVPGRRSSRVRARLKIKIEVDSNWSKPRIAKGLPKSHFWTQLFQSRELVKKIGLGSFCIIQLGGLKITIAQCNSGWNKMENPSNGPAAKLPTLL